MQELFAFAHHLADESAKVITRYFRTGFEVERKADETPVTIADRTVEARLREIIEAQRPEDGILGEEYGPKESRSGYTWVLDPIDGTKSFTVGRASFGTLIAYCKDEVPLLGVIDQPILKERWIGNGQQTFFNGSVVRTKTCGHFKEAKIASTAPSQIPDQWQTINDSCQYMVWGGDCYSYGLLANGWLDVIVENGLAPYDYAALVPIVQGAGGWMGDWNGNPLTLSSSGQTLAVGDVTLKEPALKVLR